VEPTALSVPVADGVRLHVRHLPGEPDRAPFLLVHGLSSNARLWDGVAARLAAAGHQTYAVDLRSHGGSDRPDTGYDTATAAADVAAVTRSLDLAPAVVAGQSWGGNVTVAVAAENPDRVRAVALVDGGWIDLRAQFPSWEECEDRLRPPDMDGISAADLAGQLRRAHPDWEDWAIEATLANFEVDTATGRLARRLPVPLHMRILRSMWDDPPSPRFSAVVAPALLIPAVATDDTRARGNGPGGSGKHDLVARAAAAMPRATVTEYVGADHDLHAQQPRRLAADLLLLAARTTAAPPDHTTRPTAPSRSD
jgi:pimeloyl-ACP methyl ester carboxylesterase